MCIGLEQSRSINNVHVYWDRTPTVHVYWDRTSTYPYFQGFCFVLWQIKVSGGMCPHNDIETYSRTWMLRQLPTLSCGHRPLLVTCTKQHINLIKMDVTTACARTKKKQVQIIIWMCMFTAIVWGSRAKQNHLCMLEIVIQEIRPKLKICLFVVPLPKGPELAMHVNNVESSICQICTCNFSIFLTVICKSCAVNIYFSVVFYLYYPTVHLVNKSVLKFIHYF